MAQRIPHLVTAATIRVFSGETRSYERHRAQHQLLTPWYRNNVSDGFPIAVIDSVD
jgi:hypothetical protein